MNIEGFLMALILSLPVAAITLTITKASIFEPVRNAAVKHSRWGGKLLTCPYCFSHWVALAVVCQYRVAIIDSGIWPIDYMMSAFAIVAMAMPVSWAVFRSMRGMAEDKESDEVIQLRATLQKAREVIIEQGRRLKSAS